MAFYDIIGPSFLLIPADLEANLAICLDTGCTRQISLHNASSNAPGMVNKYAEVGVSSQNIVTLKCIGPTPVTILRTADQKTSSLATNEMTLLLPFDRFWLAHPSSGFVLVSNSPRVLLPDQQLLAEHYRRASAHYRTLVRWVIMAGHRQQTHDSLPLDLLLHALAFLPIEATVEPFHLYPSRLRGITTFQSPQNPEIGVHLSLYPSGHVGVFAHHPSPMPDATARLIHYPSGYPILQVDLEDIPIDVATFGFPVLLKRELLESLTPNNGFLLLEVTYKKQHNPALAFALRTAVKVTDEVLAQAFSKSCAAPFQRARLLLQVRPAFPLDQAPDCGRTIFSAIHYAVREQGLYALWRGNVFGIIRDLFTRALHALSESYTAFEITLSPHNTTAFASCPSYVLRLLLRGFCCSLSPTLSSLLLYPVEALHTLLAVGVRPAPLQGNAIYKYFLQAPWMSTFVGFPAGSLCLFLHRLTFMALQDEACRRFRPIRRRRLLLQLMNFAAAFLAYPLDTIKRNQMVHAAFYGTSISALQCCLGIIRHHGVLALWNGFFGNLVRSWLTALVLVMFDLLRAPPSKQISLMWRRLISNIIALGAVLLLN